ncbi:hypothetical protein [Sulfurirhabdus autotrophica]|uniref:Uncharacterized protein n=1 Tax=Sulfurirhabdus autotrophica TaxID=1706046 RepID=A0A4R3Y2E9_9PROT|nr:hypothetical protein [Sulfurirhabdus autotrophica]TCV86325.1 hypothetical protein EDC63_10712 [Sulfurirhabdus autotrophica]
MTKHQAVTWWMSQLSLQLHDFMESPLGGSKAGLLELIHQYENAVKDKQIVPPKFGRER